MSRAQAVGSAKGSMNVVGSEKGLLGSDVTTPVEKWTTSVWYPQEEEDELTSLLVSNTLDEEPSAILRVEVSACPGNLWKSVDRDGKAEDTGGEGG